MTIAGWRPSRSHCGSSGPTTHHGLAEARAAAAMDAHRELAAAGAHLPVASDDRERERRPARTDAPGDRPAVAPRLHVETVLGPREARVGLRERPVRAAADDGGERVDGDERDRRGRHRALQKHGRRGEDLAVVADRRVYVADERGDGERQPASGAQHDGHRGRRRGRRAMPPDDGVQPRRPRRRRSARGQLRRDALGKDGLRNRVHPRGRSHARSTPYSAAI
jgi:hypothetical protein